MSENPSVVIVGSGFAGLGMAIQLIKAGFHDFVILEKDKELGGTWRDNTYPGCACDVPSHMYSYSFELNPRWSRLFAPQQEIWDYMRDVAAKYGLEKYLRYDSRVDALEYDDQARRWDVIVADGRRYRPRAVIYGIGALHVPSYPDLPGLPKFQGKTFHSAEWDHDYDLTGKRVAVIGTGASAIQFVPQVAKKASQLYVFQRTAPWIQPKPDVAIPKSAQWLFEHVPGTARVFRDALFWILEGRALGFALDPRLMAPLEHSARSHLKRQIPDPELRRKLTPNYRIGCKRILLSNDYYPTFNLPHVELVTEGIGEVTENAIVTGDGRELEVDCIIYGTGFKVVETLASQHIVGRNGLKIQEAWADGAEAYHGVTIPGFPNFFMLMGPNTGLGHHSMIFMMEAQFQHILGCLRLIQRQGGDTIEVTRRALRRYNDRMHRRLRKGVWNEGGCQSWYLDENGVNRTLWPGFAFEYWAGTRRVKASDYVVS
ncbi:MULTISPECIES: flavin-containing monooxygenase [Thermomonospora]|uniref:FAD-dependent pyridine nucleotide-disulphide oxidoreductase n=1 Tax=Thermomonospora curvata (strain ATCC 19995 / DSM 43183 / JCM 3096 / KCTC 9072 / NBRC 15933 / NCIMB 10081 / Henssen B9) TaxID=471852 RepID=D1AD57_THECD|nr:MULTISPECIES: NAD(P)/FAD-dependent oxidoreductase [Thermomonospora]ACY99366.1 FAD-dependent pyridine nucleotide-disulphide oxidoreductase [Thermomonospora curvata DSM 43183]PKK12415.1 MAG: NAD(P)/FAD-dependent oxidoreductase [Thermomonospora sp. CIF 1]